MEENKNQEQKKPNIFSVQPDNIESAVATLMQTDTESHPWIKDHSEQEFLSKTHHFFGQNMRNGWFLWWSEEGAAKYSQWPKEKPSLIKEFNDMGIVHADDMSGILLTTFYRRLTGKEEDIPGQVKYYQDFWKKNGYPDGIPKQSNS